MQRFKKSKYKMIFRHLKRLMRKNDCGMDGKMIEVFNEQVTVIKSEKEGMNDIESFWSKLFTSAGNASMGLRKYRVGEGMIEGECGFTLCEFEFVLKKLRREKEMDEDGVIAEHLMALDVRNKREVVKLMNEVLNGRDVPKEWKKSRVNLVYKGGCKKSVKSYGPIAIISNL